MGLKDRFRVWVLKKVLNDSTLYDIVSAIRGCDSGNTALKYLLTSRIRFLAGLDPDDAYADVRVNKEVELWVLYKAVESVSKADVHCLEHIEFAINALRRLKLMDEEEAGMLYAIATTLTKTARGLIERDKARKKIEELTEKYRKLIEP